MQPPQRCNYSCNEVATLPIKNHRIENQPNGWVFCLNHSKATKYKGFSFIPLFLPGAFANTLAYSNAMLRQRAYVFGP